MDYRITFMLDVNAYVCVKAERTHYAEEHKLRYAESLNHNNINTLTMNGRRTQLHNINFRTSSKAEI